MSIPIDTPEYQQAITSIRENSYNITNIPIHLIDIRLMRFVRKRNFLAAEAYCPKGLKKAWLQIILDHVIILDDPDIEI